VLTLCPRPVVQWKCFVTMKTRILTTCWGGDGSRKEWGGVLLTSLLSLFGEI
jgi:hypothetical protein